MLKNKRGAELSITLIIILILGLIVLVVMIAIFGKETGKTIGTLESCESKGGKCISLTPLSCSDGRIIYDVKCRDNSQVCCVEI